MREIPFLNEVAARVEPIPDGIDLATTLIAKVDPAELQNVTDQTYRMNWYASLRSKDDLVKQAEANFDATLNAPSMRSMKKAARERLEESLADQQQAAEVYEIIQPELKLAAEIEKKKLILSRPARYLTTLACAMTLGGITAVPFYEAAKESNKQAQEITIEYNKKATESQKLDMPSENLDQQQVIVIGIFGGAMTLMGASLGAMIGAGSRINRNAAHRRAKRQYQRAS